MDDESWILVALLVLVIVVFGILFPIWLAVTW